MLLFANDHHQPKAGPGVHRVRSASETLARFTPVGVACGITRLANLTGLDFVGVPVAMAVRPDSRSVSVSQGKGFDREAARASALMESIETWHAENVARPVRFASARTLALEVPIIDLGRLRTLSGGPPPLDVAIPWVEGWDLLSEGPRWVPLEVVSMDTTDRAALPGIFPQSTNGLASGNHILEAVLHALYELIERDAVTLNALDERQACAASLRLDLAGIAEPSCRSVLDRVEAAGLCAAAYDVTSDVGIPTCAALVLDRPGALRRMGFFWGFGTHLVPEVALLRALTEAVQCRLTEVSGAREDIASADYARGRDDEVLAALIGELEGAPPGETLDRHPARATPTLEGDLAIVLSALRKAGVTSAVAVDLTRPELAVPVVKVVAPELEPLFSGPHYRPGARALRVLGSGPALDGGAR